MAKTAKDVLSEIPQQGLNVSEDTETATEICDLPTLSRLRHETSFPTLSIRGDQQLGLLRATVRTATNVIAEVQLEGEGIVLTFEFKYSAPVKVLITARGWSWLG